jgi:hypothetical protein
MVTYIIFLLPETSTAGTWCAIPKILPLDQLQPMTRSRTNSSDERQTRFMERRKGARNAFRIKRFVYTWTYLSVERHLTVRSSSIRFGVRFIILPFNHSNMVTDVRFNLFLWMQESFPLTIFNRRYIPSTTVVDSVLLKSCLSIHCSQDKYLLPIVSGTLHLCR